MFDVLTSSEEFQLVERGGCDDARTVMTGGIVVTVGEGRGYMSVEVVVLVMSMVISINQSFHGSHC